MQIHMMAMQFPITPSLRDYVERRLRFAMSPARHRIGDIAIRLRDLHGPRGGRDMQCQVRVTLPGRREVVVKEVHEDMYASVDRAVKRAAYRVIRSVSRQHMSVRQSARPALQAGDTMPAKHSAG
jgi:ribosomal subunit interface protein